MPRMFTSFLLLAILAAASGLQANAPPPRPKPDPKPKVGKPVEVSLGERVTSGLKWLADHQNFEGYWSGDEFGADTTRKEAAQTATLNS